MQQIVSKTFASQFFTPLSDTIFDRQINAIKNGRIDILHSISNEDSLHQKDAKGKNLLFYAAYYKQPSILLYLLRRGVPIFQKSKTSNILVSNITKNMKGGQKKGQQKTKKQMKGQENKGQQNKNLQIELSQMIRDIEQKSIIHTCCYSASLQCLQVLRFYIRLQRIKKLADSYGEMLHHYGYMRTDFKNGQLKYEVSEKRQNLFYKLQSQATHLYKDYLLNHINQLANELSTTESTMNRNCLHLVCLNKYQKCYSLLQFIIDQFNRYNFQYNQKLQSFVRDTNQIMKDSLDPRVYSDVNFLIEEIIDPKVKEKMHMQAQTKIKVAICKILQAKDKQQFTPLHIASRNGSTAMINLLLKYQHNLKEGSSAESIIEIAPHNLARSHIMDLCQASKMEKTHTINFLISCGQEINKKKTIFGTFPLLESVKAFHKGRNLDPIKTLLKSGADVNEQDTNGWTIMHHAASLGLFPIAQLLIKQYNPDLTKRTNKNYHILHLASSNDCPQIIQMIITHNIKKQLIAPHNQIIVDNDGCTPLHHAAKKGALKALKKLTQLKVDLYALDRLKMSALHHAALNNHSQCIRFLIQRDSDYDKLINMKDSKQKIPKQLCSNDICKKSFQNIFTAARKGDINLVRKLTISAEGVKDAITPKNQYSALILSVIQAKPLIVKYLIENGADQYTQDSMGKTALQHAKQQLENAIKSKDKPKQQLYNQILKLF